MPLLPLHVLASGVLRAQSSADVGRAQDRRVHGGHTVRVGRLGGQPRDDGRRNQGRVALSIVHDKDRVPYWATPWPALIQVLAPGAREASCRLEDVGIIDGAWLDRILWELAMDTRKAATATAVEKEGQGWRKSGPYTG